MSEQILPCDEFSGLARRRYNRRVIGLTAAYAVLVIGMAVVLKATEPAPALRYVIALVAAAPAVGMIAALGAYIGEEPDEFRRSLLVQAMLWGLGFTLAATTVWGFAELFADAPRLLLALVFPIFMVAMSLAHHLLRRRYR
jgi:hypothetical protein